MPHWISLFLLLLHLTLSQQLMRTGPTSMCTMYWRTRLKTMPVTFPKDQGQSSKTIRGITPLLCDCTSIIRRDAAESTSDARPFKLRMRVGAHKISIAEAEFSSFRSCKIERHGSIARLVRFFTALAGAADCGAGRRRRGMRGPGISRWDRGVAGQLEI